MPEAAGVDGYLNVASLVVVGSIKIMGSVRNSRTLFVSLQKKENNYEVYS